MENALPVLFAQALSEQQARPVSWQIEGQSGLDINGLIERLNSLAIDAVDVVLISIGVNDVTGLTSTRQWRVRVTHLLDCIHRSWPTADVVFAGLPPMDKFPLPPQPLRFTLGWRASTLDSIASGICAGRSGVNHVPTVIDPQVHSFSEDGYHPSYESCAVWARELADAVPH
jgi:lysophospholipase L1-like esterase